jgi:hypothetical protein
MSRITDRLRVAIVVATALLLGASTYAQASGLDWPGADLIVSALAVLGVFLVYRWWALFAAVAPALVVICLYAFTDYSSHEREDLVEAILADNPLLFLLLMAFGAFMQAVFLAVGLLLRWWWEQVRERRRRRALPGVA